MSMDEKTTQIMDSLTGMVREFKGADFIEPDGDIASLSFSDDFELDSLDIINLLFQVDEQYSVKIAGEDLEEHQLLIIGNMAKFIAENG